MPDPVSSNAHLAVEMETISFVNTQAREADFQVKCKAVTLHSTELVRIGFDSQVASAGSFLLPADVAIDIRDIKFTRISALGEAGSGSLYILARR